MLPAEAALARSRAYTLFGMLYLEGVTPHLLPTLGALPELAGILDETGDADEAAADHHQVLGLNVFPHAGLFLDPEGRLGGPLAEEIRRLYQRSGFGVNAAEDADHAGHELGFLAFLAGAEADAWEDALPAQADRLCTLQRRFLDTHLLWWLPVFTQALYRQGHPFYAALATLTLDLVADHRAALGPGADGVHPSPLPDAPALLDDEATGLREIAGFLTTPAWSGLYLSRNDIARLARAERLPRGFGGRALMLTNLLRAAIAYDRLDPLLAGLAETVGAWQAHYTALAQRGLPILADIAAAWLARLDATRRVIDQIREAAQAPGDNDSLTP